MLHFDFWDMKSTLTWDPSEYVLMGFDMPFVAGTESFCGVSFKEHRVMPRARRGGELAVLPCWAEELRQEMLAGRCFTDPEAQMGWERLGGMGGMER